MAVGARIGDLGLGLANPDLFSKGLRRKSTERSGSIPIEVTTFPIAAERVIVVEPKNDAVLFERNPDALGPVGSIQKLLTALLVIERGALNTSVEIHPEDIPADRQRLPVIANLRQGDVHSRQCLLTAMLVGSANDAANALARDHSGSVTAFVTAMDVRAKELGMTNSKFFNPTGLPHDEQVSTAGDIAELAKWVDEISTLRAIVCMPAYMLSHGDGTITRLNNTNRLLRTPGVCDGMKTGFTRASGRCLVASGSFGKLRRIVVVLNSTADQVWSDARQLLNCSLGITNPTSGVAGVAS